MTCYGGGGAVGLWLVEFDSKGGCDEFASGVVEPPRSPAVMDHGTLASEGALVCLLAWRVSRTVDLNKTYSSIDATNAVNIF